MKRVIALLTVAVLLLCGLTACRRPSAASNKVDDGKYTIGICQLAPHEALDAATQGFQDAVTAAFGAENVTFMLKNASGENSVCTTIVNDFVTKDVDLIMANATGALQAAYNATQTIPVLGTSITEYGVALGIKDFTGVVGSNVSGTSDLAPLNEQAQMVIDLVPSAKTVGILYCSAEANSAYQVKVVKEYLEGKNLTVKEYAFTASNDVAQFAATAAAECDALYIPTDNTAASCAETINNAVINSKTPIICGDFGTCKGCGIATLSIDYYNLGKKTGEMAVKILKGEEKIETMAIQYDESPVKQYNKAICDELGITVPAEYKELS